MEIERIVRIAWKNHAVVLMISFLIITSPFLALVLYFFPLIISTVLCVLALVSIAPQDTETELVERIVGESQQTITSGSCHLLGSYATWLQWLMGMDHHLGDQICSDIPSTSSSSQDSLICEETTLAGATDQELRVKTCGASSCDEEILRELPIAANSDVEIDNCHVEREELIVDSFEVESSIQDPVLPCLEAVRKQQLISDFNALKVFMQVRIIMKEIRTWLSLLNCGLLCRSVARWSRKTFREEKMSRPDLCGCLFIPERFTVRLREDPEQRYLKITEGSEKIANLAEEPCVDAVGVCTFTNSCPKSGHLAMNSFDPTSIAHYVDSYSSHEGPSSLYMEDDLSSGGDSGSDCSDSSDIWDNQRTYDQLKDVGRSSTIESSICEEQPAKEDRSGEATEELRFERQKISELAFERLSSTRLDALETGAAPAGAQGVIDHDLLSADDEKLADVVEADPEKTLTSSVYSSTDDVTEGQLVDKEANREIELRDGDEERVGTLLDHASATNSVVKAQGDHTPISIDQTTASSNEEKEPSREGKLSRHVRSWPTLQEVLATRTKENNFVGFNQSTTLFVVCLLTQRSKE